MKAALALLFSAIILFSSCSDNIIGTWKITRYEKGDPGDESVKVENIGTITFRNNKRGDKDINYGRLGNRVSDKSSFRWRETNDYLTITDDDSEFAKTWIRVKNKRKIQLLRTTNGANTVQELELRK